MTEVTTDSDQTNIAAVVLNWTTESNGKWEARRFRLQPAPSPELSPGLLRQLGLESLAGASPTDLQVEPVSAPNAFAVLFAAASLGGAYSSGLLGAYGRLAAWKSLRGLLAIEADVHPESAQEDADAVTWIQFSAKTDWFYQVAWDIGIAAFRPENQSLGVLAATDTD